MSEVNWNKLIRFTGNYFILVSSIVIGSMVYIAYKPRIRPARSVCSFRKNGISFYLKFIFFFRLNRASKPSASIEHSRPASFRFEVFLERKKNWKYFISFTAS